jgi:ketosteroid isomerase-like protein
MAWRSRERISARSRVLVLVAVAAALMAAGGALAVSRGSSSEGDQLREIERTRLQALVDADIATARPLMAPDFEVINPGGAVSGRDDYMDALEGGVIDYLVFEPASPITVRRSGDSAALRFQARFDLVVGGDTRVTHRGWITELYERRDGRWRIAWEQATAIPNDVGLFVESIKAAS